MKEVKYNNFWSGITNEIRSTLPSAFWYSENLEVGKGKSVKQVVNNQAENVGTYDVNNFVTKLIQVGTDVYGLGQDNNTNKDTSIWKKTNALDSNWAIVTNGTIAGSTFRAGDSLFAYLNSAFYFDGGNDYVSKYSGTTMTATWKSLAGGMKGGTIWQGNIYGWNGQYIYEINPVADTLTQKIQIPSDQTIVDIVASGNLLQIICTSTTTVSRMYIWDGVSTTVFVDIVDIGMGTVSGGAVLEGQTVIAISTPNKRTLKLRGYVNGLFQNLFTYTGRSNQAGTYNYILPASKLKVFSGFIYFIITGTKPDGTYAGLYEYAIARFGREEPINPITFSIYKTLDFSSARGLDGQTTNNDFTIIESIVGGTTTVDRAIHAVIYSDTNKTTFFSSSSSTYTAEAGVLETTKFSGVDKNGQGDVSINKQLVGISVQYSPLPTAGQIICKYKKDEDTYWTTIFVDGTDNAMSHEATNIESYTDAVTMSIASPAVVTLTDHRLVPGQIVRFNTTGALPTGVTAGTEYYVLSTSLTSSTFRFSATSGGSAINTTGTQSGTHTIDRTFNLPIFKEIQFRFELLGGAELVGYKLKYEDLNNAL